MRRRASLATESADRRVNNLAENRSTESEAGRSQTGLDVKSRFTEGRISEVLSPGPSSHFIVLSLAERGGSGLHSAAQDGSRGPRASKSKG